MDSGSSVDNVCRFVGQSVFICAAAVVSSDKAVDIHSYINSAFRRPVVAVRESSFASTLQVLLSLSF